MRECGLPAACSRIIFGLHVYGNIAYNHECLLTMFKSVAVLLEQTDSLHWGQQSTHFICKPTAEVWAWRVPIPPWLSSGAILRSLPPMFPGESYLFPGSLQAMCSLSWSHISGIQIVFSSWIDWFLLHNLGKTDLKINASNDAQFFNKKAIMLCSYQTENKNSGVQSLTAACSNSTAVVTTLKHNAYKCFLPPTCSLPPHCHKLLT